MLGVLAVLALMLVLRGQKSTDRTTESARAQVAPIRHAQVGSLALVDASRIEDSQKLFPGVRSDYLDDVRDDTVFRASESDAWFHLLELLGKTSESDLEAASLGSVGYLQLSDQAPSYRGRLVSLSGIVRKAKRIAAPQNAYGVEQYYQLWLQPERSAPELIVLYALQLPADFPLGDELDTPIEATGFFYKRWAYTATDGIRTVPLVVAKTVRWQPPAPVTAEAPVGEQLVLSLVVAAIVAALAVVAVVVRNRHAAQLRQDQKSGSEIISLPEEFTGGDTSRPPFA